MKFSDNIEKAIEAIVNYKPCIEYRTLNTYYNLTLKMSSNVEIIREYDTIYNSVLNNVEPNYPMDTDGYKAISKHIDENGIQSERIEQMLTLADTDCWILNILNKRKINE